MREIKFRAWDKDNNCMIDNWYEITEEKFTKKRFFGKQVQTLATKVMQYTGLKDKNGKEIYEGDIIKCSDGILEIIWVTDSRDFCGLTFKMIKNNDRNVVYDIRMYRSDEDWEVIGNIYEKKNLLEAHK